MKTPRNTHLLLAGTIALVLVTGVFVAQAAKKDKKSGPQDYHHFTFKWQKDLDPVWIDPTEGILDKALQNELTDVEEVVYAVRANGRDWHWYASFGYNINNPDSYYYGGRGGALCVLNLRTKEVRTLLEDPEGDVRDPAVHYDGKTILFSYRKGGTNQFHLYTIQADGSNLTQLTDSEEFDDVQPCWLPDGGIMFCSTRCMRWVPCWYAQVAIMYRCEADGSDLKPVSFGVENENTPWPLDSGRIAYTRWEYVDRSQLKFHGLWTINPDGTGVQLLYDNMGTANLYIDAKPIPGSDKISTVIIPGHGRNEQRGRIGILDPTHGTESEKAVRFLDAGYCKPNAEKMKGHVEKEAWRDPYPLSENCFLVASERSLCVMNGEGQYEIVYELPDTFDKKLNLHEPRPLTPREKEPVIPHVTPSEDGMATFYVMDVTVGRNMKGIAKGQIKKLLVMEELPRPGANCAYADVISNGPNYILHRILGTVPVEEDGSAHFKAPAGRPIFFYALDENDLSAKVMPSYLSAMSGEIVSCVGCHEDRAMTPVSQYKSQMSIAMKRPPSQLQQDEGIPEIFDYVRDIQPIWDKHCVKCHNYDKYAGDLLLVGDMTASWSVSYHELKKQRSGNKFLINNKPGYEPNPYSIASGDSILIKTLMKGHKDVKLSETELLKIKRWADAGTTFAGTYAALDSVDRGERIQLENKRDEEYTKRMEPIRQTLEKRCDTCHQSKRSRNHWLEGENRQVAYRFNMTHPDKSLVLLAPLAKSAGGLELCKKDKKDPADAPESPIFETKDDPDYKVLQDLVGVVVEQQGHPRWFHDDHVPVDWYIREMKRFGAIPEDYEHSGPNALSGYEIDERYFNILYRQGPGPKPKD